MAHLSPTVLAFPDGYQKPSGQTIHFLGNPSAVSGSQSGWYSAVPQIVASGAPTIAIGQAIECTGYDEVYIYPVALTGQETMSLSVYGIYGDRQSGMTSTRWMAHKLCDLSCAVSTGGLAMTSAGGTAYLASQALTFTGAFTTVIDAVVGCTTTKVDGTAQSPAVLGISHIAGAEYIIIAMGSTNNAFTGNAYVRFG
jgi:hypothetical protein